MFRVVKGGQLSDFGSEKLRSNAGGRHANLTVCLNTALLGHQFQKYLGNSVSTRGLRQMSELQQHLTGLFLFFEQQLEVLPMSGLVTC